MYSPEVVQIPAVPDHVTDVLVEPVTVALNCCAAPARRVTEGGLIVTPTGKAVATTVTVAEAYLFGSATLLAVTV